MKTVKYARKPFYVDAIQVTAENMKAVAKWCQGTITTDGDGVDYIKVRVHRPLTEDQTKAYIGKWVLYAGTGYKVYTAAAFEKSFAKVTTLSKEEADKAGIFVPHEPRQLPKIAADLKVTAKPGPPKSHTPPIPRDPELPPELQAILDAAEKH